jgi:CheY-like chemotaxis protein
MNFSFEASGARPLPVTRGLGAITFSEASPPFILESLHATAFAPQEEESKPSAFWDLKKKVTENFFRFSKPPIPERERILIVDDEAPIQGLFLDFFKKRGYRVTTAWTLAEAEEKLSSESFDLVLQDVILPDGDGIEFVPRIKALQSIPVIILTGLGYDEAIFQDAINHQADSYLSKLLPLDQVLMEMHRVFKSLKRA